MRTGYTVAEVAELLNISRPAVRKRIERGTLDATKQDNGTWRVYLSGRDNATEEAATVEEIKVDSTLLLEAEIEALKGEIRRLEQVISSKDNEVARLEDIIEELNEAARRQDSILMNLTNRLPQQLPEKSSWWKRLFGK